MEKQQSTLNGYLTNWSLMAIISFTWLRMFFASLASETGLMVLQEKPNVQLMTSLAFANLIPTVSILIHIYIKRNLACQQLHVISGLSRRWANRPFSPNASEGMENGTVLSEKWPASISDC